MEKGERWTMKHMTEEEENGRRQKAVCESKNTKTYYIMTQDPCIIPWGILKNVENAPSRNV